MKKYITQSPSQTKKLGESLAKKILRTGPKSRAIILGLEGNLGSGKTTFIQGFARGLGIREKILSPTFVIIKRFQVSSSRFQDFYHIDCYRIQKSKEVLDLGFRKIIGNPQNIVVIEWADLAKEIIPKTAAWAKFEFINKNTRKIMLK